MVAEAAAGPSQDEEARQASVQELQSLRESLSQAEAKTRELEGQLENINKVKLSFTLSVCQNSLRVIIVQKYHERHCWPATGCHRA